MIALAVVNDCPPETGGTSEAEGVDEPLASALSSRSVARDPYSASVIGQVISALRPLREI